MFNTKNQNSLEEQVSFFNQLRRDHHSVVELPIAVSLAGPLLPALDLEGFTFDIVGNANSGKSTLLGLSASVCNDPVETVHNTDTAAHAYERMYSSDSPLPFFLDDVVTAVVPPSCGINVLASETQVVQSSDDLTMNLENSPSFLEKVPDIKRFTAEHYGWIGQEFMRVLQDEDHLAEAKDLVDHFVDKLRKNGFTAKQASCAAACLAADTLASKYVFRDEDASLRLTIDEFTAYPAA